MYKWTYIVQTWCSRVICIGVLFLSSVHQGCGLIPQWHVNINQNCSFMGQTPHIFCMYVLDETFDDTSGDGKISCRIPPPHWSLWFLQHLEELKLYVQGGKIYPVVRNGNNLPFSLDWQNRYKWRQICYPRRCRYCDIGVTSPLCPYLIAITATARTYFPGHAVVWNDLNHQIPKKAPTHPTMPLRNNFFLT